MKRSILFAFGAVVAFGFSWNPQGFRLVRSPKVGQELRYRLNAEFDLAGTDAAISALIIERVVAVEAEKYTLESVQKQGRAKHGPIEQDMPDSSVASAVYLLSGEPAEIKSGNEDGSQGRLARMNAFVAPDKEVKIGDSWSHTYRPSAFSGGIGGKVDYRILSSEKLGLKTTLLVQITYKESGKANPAESTGKAWIDVENGELVKLESNWKNAPMMGADAQLNAKITLTREG